MARRSLTPLAAPIDLRVDPERFLRAWPADRGLAVLWSADAGDGRWSRWSIFAEPVGALRTEQFGASATRTRWHGPSAPPCSIPDAADPLAAIIAAETTHAPVARDADTPPFRGGWIGSLGYELGHAIEPASARTPRHGQPRAKSIASGWPLAILHRCPAAYAHDRVTNQWWLVGDEAAVAALPPASVLESPPPPTDPVELTFDEDHLTGPSRRIYTDGVARVVEYIRAGDVFQVNLAHMLDGPFTGSPRDLFAEMADAASPWYGAYIEDVPHHDGTQAVLSISPELFLDFDPATRLVTTRPIKGTLRAGAGRDALAASPKDAAELAMIVDLMRNDLGRVCDFGSIRVAEARALELHARRTDQPPDAGLLHGVATVEGRLRAGLAPADLLRATFPGGSVTGAPKIRAMQIIRERERFQRGPYTGSIGYLSDCGRACFNIAIRTAHVSRLTGRQPNWRYHTGAGIVADSHPAGEWDETIAKAEVMLHLARDHPPLARAAAATGAL